MVPLRSAFATLILLATAVGAARAQTPAQIEERFFAAQAQARTVAARVTQALTLPGSSREVVSRAEVFFARPGRLVIRYVEPAGDFVLLRDETVVTRKGDRPPVERPLARDASGLESWRSLLAGRSPQDWARDWLRDVTRNGDTIVVTLTPRAAGRDAPRSVVLTVDVAALTPQTMAITLRNGARLAYRFERFQRNAELPANAFAP